MIETNTVIPPMNLRSVDIPYDSIGNTFNEFMELPVGQLNENSLRFNSGTAKDIYEQYMYYAENNAKLGRINMMEDSLLRGILYQNDNNACSFHDVQIIQYAIALGRAELYEKLLDNPRIYDTSDPDATSKYFHALVADSYLRASCIIGKATPEIIQKTADHFEEAGMTQESHMVLKQTERADISALVLVQV